MFSSFVVAFAVTPCTRLWQKRRRRLQSSQRSVVIRNTPPAPAAACGVHFGGFPAAPAPAAAPAHRSSLIVRWRRQLRLVIVLLSGAVLCDTQNSVPRLLPLRFQLISCQIGPPRRRRRPGRLGRRGRLRRLRARRHMPLRAVKTAFFLFVSCNSGPCGPPRRGAPYGDPYDAHLRPSNPRCWPGYGRTKLIFFAAGPGVSHKKETCFHWRFCLI